MGYMHKSEHIAGYDLILEHARKNSWRYIDIVNTLSLIRVLGINIFEAMDRIEGEIYFREHSGRF